MPVFDLGVSVETNEGNIKSIQARVTTLMPGAACLFCRGRISGDVIAAEILQETNPSEYESQRKQGYIPELGTQAPASFLSRVPSLPSQSMNFCTGSADIWAMIVSAQNCFFSSTTHATAETRCQLPRSACARSEKNGGAVIQTLFSAFMG
jgi:hypothetical protein